MADASSNSSLNVLEPPIQWPMAKGSYEFGKSIGATSIVYEASCPTNGRKCAIKIINLEKCSTSASLEEINREIKSMKNMKNENIVAYYASFVDQTELCIVMDWCQRGSLLDVIKYTQSKRDISFGVFDEGTIATILRDVLRGLAYIHENGLVHRDLKCGNLLVKDDGIIQIADFGVAGFLASQPLTATDSVDLRRFTFVGTPCWMAPEVMQQKADIWSLGITTIEMATGQAPYAKYAPMKVLMLTLQNDPPDIDTVATVSNQYADYGQKFRKFTRACLVKDPAQRLSARELLGHTYIKAKAKDRDLLCRVLLGGEMPPPVTRSNKHTEDRADKRDPKTKSTEWNFDTIGRGPQGALDSDDSDEPDYGSGLALSDPDAGQHVPNQTVIAGSPSTDGTRAAAAAAAAAVSACGTSAFSGCGSLPPAPACTPVSPDGVVSGMVGAFADVMIDPNFAVGGSGQSVNPEDGVRKYGPINMVLLKRRAGVVLFVHRDASPIQRVTLLHSDWATELFGQIGHTGDMLSKCGACACASLPLTNIASSHVTVCGRR
ncbi:hypothetical protein EG68_09460 [Paragonimus skrjabini miyazakii]|uniref:Protein kinase domain-containing protein n=1 Tax=Paragonimus skrjabini miyazakii TaxID=59628 RepID=A0A8S9YM11_9TREM|nr:hypothetical protein EG68_09460 [Paragonimus skrjabini miyazakii]